MSLATRLPLSLFILSTTTILLLLQQQKRVALHAILGGLYCFVLLDPILFTRPVDHLRAVFSQAILHTNQLVRGTITLFDIAAFAPFACLSFSLGIAIFFLYKRLSLPFSQLFLAYTLLLTLGLLGIFTHTSVQTMRYLYVPIFWWDVMLPIQLLSLTHATRLSPLLARYLVTISIIGSFSVYLFIRWFYYLLPEVLLQLLRVPVP